MVSSFNLCYKNTISIIVVKLRVRALSLRTKEQSRNNVTCSYQGYSCTFFQGSYEVITTSKRYKHKLEKNKSFSEEKSQTFGEAQTEKWPAVLWANSPPLYNQNYILYICSLSLNNNSNLIIKRGSNNSNQSSRRQVLSPNKETKKLPQRRET